MGLLSKKEFAKMCRTTVAVIDTNIHRGKITYLKKDKVLDTEDPLNKAFFDKYYERTSDGTPVTRQKNTPSKEEIEAVIEEKYLEVVKTVKEEGDKKAKDKRVRKSAAKSESVVSWDARKKRADALLQERKAEREQLNLEKLAGKLIPVDLVFQIIKIHNHDIFATFQNDAENLASVFCDILAGGDRKKLSEITTKLSSKLEDCVKRAKDVSMASIEQAVEDYSDTRNRGESK